MGSCIIMLKHEVMVVDEWHNNGPEDLVTESLSINCTWVRNIQRNKSDHIFSIASNRIVLNRVELKSNRTAS